MLDDKYLIVPSAPSIPSASPRVEIARSFSYKLNVGNFESRDFFCSQKRECAIEEADTVSEQVFNFCRAQVMKAVREYKEQDLSMPPAPKLHPHPVAQANAREFEKRRG